MKNFNQVKKYDNLWALFEATINDNESKIFSPSSLNISYKKLYEQIRIIASNLCEQNFKKTDRLFVEITDKYNFFLTWWACVLLGLVIITKEESLISKEERQNLHVAKIITDKKLVGDDVIRFTSLQNRIKDIITTRDFSKNISADDIVHIHIDKNDNKPTIYYYSHKNYISNIYNLMLVFPYLQASNFVVALPSSHYYSKIMELGLFSQGKNIDFFDKDFEVLISDPNYLSHFQKNLCDSISNNSKKIFYKLISLLSPIIPLLVRRVIFKKVFDLPKNFTSVLVVHNNLGSFKNSFWSRLGILIKHSYAKNATGFISVNTGDKQDSFGKALPNQALKLENNIVYTKGSHVASKIFDSKNKTPFKNTNWFITNDKAYIKDSYIYPQKKRPAIKLARHKPKKSNKNL